MLSLEVLEITYKSTQGRCKVLLDCCSEQFTEILRQVEQKLADSQARDIVYRRRPREDGDFATSEAIEQVSLFDEED